MTDPDDRFLTERLHALAGGVTPPVVPADADVRRGRRRLVRVRATMAGASIGALAVVLGVTGLTAGDPQATEPPVVGRTTGTALPATPDGSTPSGSPSRGERDGERDGGGDELTSLGGGGGGAAVGDPASGSASSDATGDGADEHSGKAGSKAGGQPGHWPTGPVVPTDGSTDDVTDGPTDTPTGSPTGSPSDEPTATPSTDGPGTPTGSPTPTGTPTTPPEDPTPPTTGPVRVPKVLSYFNEVLADHLDADRDHLATYDRRVDRRKATRIDGRLFALSGSYRWTDGDDTEAVAVKVATGWDQVDWRCGTTPATWDCAAATGAELARHDGLRQVAAPRADGQVVVVSTEVASADVSDDDLVAAALDDRLVVPGDAVPAAPPLLDAGAFGASGQAALVRDGESFTTTGWARTPSVRGTWAVAGTDRGTLAWSATPLYSGGAWTCLTTYRSCTDVVVDDAGTVVHVGALRKKGGWVLQYDGPTYAVRVSSSDPTFAKKRAYPFLVAPAWQPAASAP
ncbi:hypothetical protein G5V58_01305 [Nocardioides anomalus]|uniref:Uncharacterized protein n=1 Tax=Nocardioides anomalus TaxID=2712223 RepID=A0A6G6W8C4_9ACTN|nr:hypothetical protein [Nocardioides anomalus]QIG41588.1 hypothetical protein G5V58_01305 [Nocardioides anomalus]